MSEEKEEKRRFRVVDLVIVIAVFAILAAVLIPLFINLNKKANLTADQRTVRDMNTALQADEVAGGAPSDLKGLFTILRGANFTLPAIPMDSGYEFYWIKADNRVVLVKTDPQKIEYPDELAKKYQGNLPEKDDWFCLNSDPDAHVCKDENSTYHALSGADKNVETLHVKVCNECGKTVLESHTFEGDKCSKCGYDKNFGGAGPAEHECKQYTYHALDVEDAKAATLHVKVCIECQKAQLENHTLDENGKCTLCGFGSTGGGSQGGEDKPGPGTEVDLSKPIYYYAPNTFSYVKYNVDGSGAPSGDNSTAGKITLPKSPDYSYELLSTAVETLQGSGALLVLQQDVKVYNVLSIDGKELNIDLNGHKIQSVYEEDRQNYNGIFKIYHSGTLRIFDSSEEKSGAIVREEGVCNSLMVSASHSTFEMYGGTLENKSADCSGEGGGVKLFDATFNLYDGKILNHRSEGVGGGVNLADNGISTFNMYGGEIGGNGALATDKTTDKEGRGGGVYIGTGKTIQGGDHNVFNMYGGTIKENYIFDKNYQWKYDAFKGGGVYVATDGEFNMRGGNISANEADGNGYEIYVDSGAEFHYTSGTIAVDPSLSNNGSALAVYTDSKATVTGWPKD